MLLINIISDQIFTILILTILCVFIYFTVFNYKFIRNILFLFDPETIHHFSFKFLKILFIIPQKFHFWKYLFVLNNDKLTKNILGLKFDNPIGLAAGFDKDAKIFDGLSNFGFGFVEIGTVTPIGQEGNPKPRLFRLKEDKAIINRMGFNNEGVESVVSRLRRKKSNIIIGGNIGKNKLTDNNLAINDYEICFEKLFDHVDYFVVNVSSPNTPGLRDLQEKEPLKRILDKLQFINNSKKSRKPILLKIAPDLTNSQLDDIIEIIKETGLDGVVATNTTISRASLTTSKNKLESIGNGGLSGKPLKDRSTEVIKYLSQKSNKSFVIIGVGGINSASDAIEKIKAGADLLQIYSGFIYEGPSLVKNINKSLINL
jgi:dihydroorotate dehydrogenase|tara:strand:+ start:435 stop:1550 length:1116 start_codon:yes stop_codon:yes gene_type:complete